MANVLRATVRSVDPQLPLAQVQSMERPVSDSEAPRRFNTAIITAFAVAAVLLSVLGIYSVIAFSAALREQEMAIRHCFRVAAVGDPGLGLCVRGQTCNCRLRSGIAGGRSGLACAAVVAVRGESV